MATQAFLFLKDAAKVLSLTLDQCRVLMEWGVFPKGQRIEGTCIIVYGEAAVVDFKAQITEGGPLHDRVVYALDKDNER